MPNITAFDPKDHHIRLVGSMKTPEGGAYEIRAILDTGASYTEFSDKFLTFVGMYQKPDPAVSIKTSLQTQKYGKITLPKMTICGHDLRGMPVYISRFEDYWGIDALIGLDFFRKFEVKINYKLGTITTEAL